ncbi:Major Facilitator Superfamily (MFS) [Thraustotheca clavata]|uniref:Major Facilitator Superfamily (MFS) n=1 Tax=Thraustotheca clavata TaxID=74557 RepID=A0A1W0A4U1_9STRA|nr:Major Facilitator Superfamily (MFS) [Thraustotheca clavata]
MSLLVIVSCIIALCIALACAYDLVGPKQQKARSPHLRRLGNWFPLGLAYAAFYTARYNVSSGNTLAVRTKYAWTQQDIGGWKNWIFGCCGVAITNGFLGVVVSLDDDQLHASPRYILVVILYSLNLFMQGFVTKWYNQTERGYVFWGLFNVVLSIGYFLALGTGASILDNLGYSYLFYIPSGICTLMTVLVVINSHYPSGSPKCNINSTTSTTISSLKIESNKALLHNLTFLGYLAAIFFLCWLRDDFLNWIYPFLSSVRSEPLSSDDTVCIHRLILFCTWWNVDTFGFVGGVLIEWISNTFFHSNQLQYFQSFKLFSFSLLFYSWYLFYDSTSHYVFKTSVCTLGAYTLLGFTVPIDLPVDIAAGASGLMTCVGYIATGIANIFMGNTVEAYGYSFWIG